MEIKKLENFTRGWVVGDFDPTIISTKDFEFAVQYFKVGEHHQKHIHKIAREISIIVYGKFLTNGQPVGKGDVIVVEPGEPMEFDCLEDGACAVIKTPSVKGDKYLL